MKLTRMTPAVLKALRPEIDAALAALAAKHGILIRTGNGSYTDITATFKLEIAVAGETGETNPAFVRARKDFTEYAPLVGLRAEWLDQNVRVNGKEWTIIGYMPTRRKTPVLVRSTDGSNREVLFAHAAIRDGAKLTGLPNA